VVDVSRGTYNDGFHLVGILPEKDLTIAKTLPVKPSTCAPSGQLLPFHPWPPPPHSDAGCTQVGQRWLQLN